MASRTPRPIYRALCEHWTVLDFFNESIRCIHMDSVLTKFWSFCSLSSGNRRAAEQTGAFAPSPRPSSRRALWLMLCTLLSLPSMIVEAAEQETEQGPTATSTPATTGNPLPPSAEMEQPQSDATTPRPAPNAAQLKTRGLGAAFEKFNPSEAISADNTVPFPIDI